MNLSKFQLDLTATQALDVGQFSISANMPDFTQ